MTTGRINQVTILQGTRTLWRDATRTLWRTLPWTRRPAFNRHSYSAPGIRPAPGRRAAAFDPRSAETRPIFATSFHCFALVSSRHTGRTAKVHGMPTRYIREERVFGICLSILGQRPSRTTSIRSGVVRLQTTWLQVRSFRFMPPTEQVCSTLLFFCLQMPSFRTREHLPSRAYSDRIQLDGSFGLPRRLPSH